MIMFILVSYKFLYHILGSTLCDAHNVQLYFHVIMASYHHTR